MRSHEILHEILITNNILTTHMEFIKYIANLHDDIAMIYTYSVDKRMETYIAKRRGEPLLHIET